MFLTKKPEMMLFDVGGTLYDDVGFSAWDGLANLRLAANNPDITTDDEMLGLWDTYMHDMHDLHSKSGIKLDVPLSAVIRFVTMQCGLNFSISMTQQEEIFDRFNCTRSIISGVEELFKTAESLGIRTAIISNNMMSGDSLMLSVRHWIPSAEPEFCLTSADILFTKPHSSLFKCAAKYAHVDESSCIYCGDSLIADVAGSLGAGMSAVLIDSGLHKPLQIQKDNQGREYLVVQSWNTLNEQIKNI